MKKSISHILAFLILFTIENNILKQRDIQKKF